MISLDEFRKELELMENQYGLEEELYPYIYMLLREAGFTRKYSVRSVANASGKEKEKVKWKEIFRGYASFPDIVILDKKFSKNNNDNNDNINKFYCCVEAKNIGENLLDIGGEIEIKSGSVVCIKPSAEAKYRYYKALDVKDEDKELIEKYWGNKYEIEKVNEEKVSDETARKTKYVYKEIVDDLKLSDNENICNNIAIRNEKGDYKEILKMDFQNTSGNDWYYVGSVKEPKKLEDILREKIFFMSIEESCAIACINNNKNRELIDAKKKAIDYGQLIGELLWYGRVIYTNGKEWKYLKIKDFNDDLINKRNNFYKDNNEDKNDTWYKKFNGTKFEVIEEPLISIDDFTTESDWEDFKTELRNISKNWKRKMKNGK